MENAMSMRQKAYIATSDNQPTAKDRWRLLREVILSNVREERREQQSCPSKSVTRTNPASLHSFAGYQLMVRESPLDDEVNFIQRHVCHVDWDSSWMDIDPNKHIAISSGDTSTAEEQHYFDQHPLLQTLQEVVLACDALDYNKNRINIDRGFDDETSRPSLVVEVRFHRLAGCSSVAETPAKYFTHHCQDFDYPHQCLDYFLHRRRAFESELAHICEFRTCSIQLQLEQETQCNTTILALNMDFFQRRKHRDVYQVQCYRIPEQHIALTSDDYYNNHDKLYIRERMSHNHFSLQELAPSSNKDHSLDNTGNVCIWDSEKTLAWALTQYPPFLETNTTATILELGIGMAGLAALSLAQRLGNRAHRVILTDGHFRCIQNNRIHIRLLKAAAQQQMETKQEQLGDTAGQSSVFLLPKIECRLLLWTNNDVDSDLYNCANVTLVSDCTHFEHLHTQLLWTILQCTRSDGGKIYLCQPERGQSLHRFLNLIQTVNARLYDGHQIPPLLDIDEPIFPLLNTFHEQFLTNATGATETSTTHGPNCYRPNVHQPRIIVLTKLRDLHEQDRFAIFANHNNKNDVIH